MNQVDKWVVVRVDGKIASVSTGYSGLASVSKVLAAEKTLKYKEITATVISSGEIWNMKKSILWEDLLLFGSPFRKKIWKALFSLTHPKMEETSGKRDGSTSGNAPAIERNGNIPGIKISPGVRMMSYSDFAQYCGCPAGIRAVAHAVGRNPLPVLIPCHLIVPKETMDRIKELRRSAEQTLFKGEDLFPFRIMDYGEYALGRELKRDLVLREIL